MASLRPSWARCSGLAIGPGLINQDQVTDITVITRTKSAIRAEGHLIDVRIRPASRPLSHSVLSGLLAILCFSYAMWGMLHLVLHMSLWEYWAAQITPTILTRKFLDDW